MATADETLDLLLAAMDKRRLYIKRKIDRIDEKVKQMKRGTRGRPSGYAERAGMLRGGMLSELTTIRGLITAARAGVLRPDELWNVEDDTDDD